jgi:hypothetical protein
MEDVKNAQLLPCLVRPIQTLYYQALKKKWKETGQQMLY